MSLIGLVVNCMVPVLDHSCLPEQQLTVVDVDVLFCICLSVWSCPLVTPYYCRLGDLLCYFVYIVLCVHYCLCMSVFSCFRYFLCIL